MAPTVLLSLRPLRDEAGLSQTAMADALGVRQATISEWERGGNARVDVDVLDKLCRLLSKKLKREVTLADLRKRPKA